MSSFKVISFEVQIKLIQATPRWVSLRSLIQIFQQASPDSLQRHLQSNNIECPQYTHRMPTKLNVSIPVFAASLGLCAAIFPSILVYKQSKKTTKISSNIMILIAAQKG